MAGKAVDREGLCTVRTVTVEYNSARLYMRSIIYVRVEYCSILLLWLPDTRLRIIVAVTLTVTLPYEPSLASSL
jgi:hypothetical protein